jgi:hypothetical protein
LAESEVFQHQAAAVTKDAEYGPEPEPKEVEHGGKVIADRTLAWLSTVLISKADGIVTRHKCPQTISSAKAWTKKLAKRK